MLTDRQSSLVAVMQEFGERFTQRPALSSAVGAGGKSISYGELWNHVEKGGQFLRTLNLEPGARVLLMVEASPLWAPAFFSILKAGLIAVPVTTDTPATSLTAIAHHAGIAAAIFSDGVDTEPPDPGRARRLTLGQLFGSSLRSSAPTREATTELAMLAFTSGSTRQPVAVELTHANLLGDLMALREVRGASTDDTFLSMLPPAHLFELMGGLLGPLTCGSRVVYPGAPLPNRLIESVREDRITHACCVPGLLDSLYREVMDELAEAGIIETERRGQSLDKTAARFELELAPPDLERIISGVRARIGPTLKTLVLGGAALNPSWIRILSALNIRAEVGYGLTEASPIVSLGLATECPPGSVGSPLPGVELRIDTSGEILVRGPSITSGYYRDPEATRAALDDGWLRTGDCGRLDADGFLFITGRLKEAMVTSAGATIYPEEVEPYYASSLFSEWCVAGRAGSDGNDIPTLFVVPARPDEDRQLLKETFQQLSRVAPARFRLTEMVCLNHPLPRTALGKPRRRAVAAFSQHQT